MLHLGYVFAGLVAFDIGLDRVVGEAPKSCTTAVVYVMILSLYVSSASGIIAIVMEAS